MTILEKGVQVSYKKYDGTKSVETISKVEVELGADYPILIEFESGASDEFDGRMQGGYGIIRHVE